MSKSAHGGTQSPHTPVNSLTTPMVVARVQSTVAKQHGNGVPRGSYVGRMQRAAAKATK